MPGWRETASLPAEVCASSGPDPVTAQEPPGENPVKKATADRYKFYRPVAGPAAKSSVANTDLFAKTKSAISPRRARWTDGLNWTHNSRSPERRALELHRMTQARIAIPAKSVHLIEPPKGTQIAINKGQRSATGKKPRSRRTAKGGANDAMRRLAAFR